MQGLIQLEIINDKLWENMLPIFHIVYFSIVYLKKYWLFLCNDANSQPYAYSGTDETKIHYVIIIF